MVDKFDKLYFPLNKIQSSKNKVQNKPQIQSSKLLIRFDI